jgi:hypothetical protein
MRFLWKKLKKCGLEIKFLKNMDFGIKMLNNGFKMPQNCLGILIKYKKLEILFSEVRRYPG